MKLVFLGNPEIAIPALDALLDAGHDIAVVVCSPDARKGRRGIPTPTPVKAHALERGLTVIDDHNELLELEYDLGIVVAYGHILPTPLLDHAPLLNIHFSLLPRWRGAAPVERAILAGDEATGVAIMAIEEGLDTGAIYAVAQTPIADTDSLSDLRDRLATLGAELLVNTIDGGLPEPVAQPDQGVTYAHKLKAADFEIAWDDSAESIQRLVRLERAWTSFRGKRLRVHAVSRIDDGASTLEEPPGSTGSSRPSAPGMIGRELIVSSGEGQLRLERVQPEGKNVMAAKDWANGTQPIGERFG